MQNGLSCHHGSPTLSPSSPLSPFLFSKALSVFHCPGLLLRFHTGTFKIFESSARLAYLEMMGFKGGCIQANITGLHLYSLVAEH